jgi:hypothetical protein
LQVVPVGSSAAMLKVAEARKRVVIGVRRMMAEDIWR